jgi:hypothetical protein
MNNQYYPIKKAYKENWKVEAKFKQYSDCFDIELVNMWDKSIDCKIGHFGYNFYFRTPYGLKYKQYKSWNTLIKAISKVSKRYNLELEYIEVNKHLKIYLA